MNATQTQTPGKTLAKTTGVLYLARNRFDLYEDTVQQPLQFPFAPTIVSDLEIVNRDELEKQLVAFIQTNKIPPASLVIVLSQEIFFTRQLSLEKEKQTIETTEFLDVVPFEHVATKLLPTKKGPIMLATNEDLYETITSILIRLGFTITCVTPAHVLDRQLHGLDKQSYGYLRGKTEYLKQNAMTKIAEVTQPTNQPASVEPSSELVQKKRTLSPVGIGLVGVFIILLLVLGFMIYSSMQPTTPSQTQPQQETQTQN